MAKEIEIEKDEYEEVSLEERVITMEKKINWILGLVVVLTILSLLIAVFVLQDGSSTSNSGNSNNTTKTEEEYNADYDVSAFKEIKAQNIEKESKNKTILVYIGRPTCGYCVQFVPILTNVQKTLGGYTTYYIDIAKILDFSSGGTIDEEADKIMQSLKTVDAQKNVMTDNWGATPMTLVIKNSKIVDSLIGYTDETTLTDFVKANKLAK